MPERTVEIPSEQKRHSEREVTRTGERYIAPPVDIYEAEEGLMVLADLPGVSKDDLDVRVDNDILTIQGLSTHAASGEPVYREYELVKFFRQFELSDKVDQAKISAELKHGVLTLLLPKVEKPEPKRIEVKVS
jgi:HSP20 family molecular chaperone IbpA